MINTRISFADSFILFHQLAMSRGYAGSASSIILYADYSLCEATAAPRGRSCSGCGGGGGGVSNFLF